MVRHNWMGKGAVEPVYTCSPRDESVWSYLATCHGCGARIQHRWTTSPGLLDTMWANKSSAELMADLVNEAARE